MLDLKMMVVEQKKEEDDGNEDIVGDGDGFGGESREKKLWGHTNK